MRWVGAVVAIAGVLAVSVAIALAERGKHPPATLHEGGGAATPPDQLAPLHAFEEARHRAADFAHLPPSDRALGPDPIAVRACPATARRASSACSAAATRSWCSRAAEARSRARRAGAAERARGRGRRRGARLGEQRASSRAIAWLAGDHRAAGA